MVENQGLVLDERRVRGLYNILARHYGPQGWWPLRSRRITAGASVNFTIGFNSGGYHPEIIHIPKNADRFEIAAGAVLTQNTSWNNASAAIDVLIERDLLSPEKILQISFESLSALIRPSGYHNQKAVKLKFLAQLFLEGSVNPERSELLSVWGVGPETADVILLYAFGRPVFVIDAYTRRILSRFTGKGEIENIDYDKLSASVQNVFYDDVECFREYHALLVLHAKKYCLKTPVCSGCPLGGACKKKKMFAKQQNFR